MKSINVDSIRDVKVVGFDVFYIDEGGQKQVYKDGLIDSAKGNLSISVKGIKLDISEIVNIGDNVDESLENVFLENNISSSFHEAFEGPQEEESDDEIVEELMEEKKESEEQLELAENQLKARQDELERLQEELDAQKRKLLIYMTLSPPKDIYVFDEVFSNMTQSDLGSLIQEVKKQVDKPIIFIISHDKNVLGISDIIYEIRNRNLVKSKGSVIRV